MLPKTLFGRLTGVLLISLTATAVLSTWILILTALLESIRDDGNDEGWDVTLEGEMRQTFLGRPLALKRCIVNLVENAVCYGGSAHIAVRDADDVVKITVSDAGPGIPADMLDRVFEPFVRLDASRAQHTGGTGLGLGIARNIARAHGGDLLLENAPEGGLKAFLTLPR
jgi:signal transduction histidine kinase